MKSESKPAAGELGVVIRNVVPVRAEPDSDSEQVTQALLGQPVTAEAGQSDWLYVQTWDTYRGWIPSNAVRFLPEITLPYASAGPVAVVHELFADILEQPRPRAPIVTKATVSVELEVAGVEKDWVEVRMPDGSAGYMRTKDVRLIEKELVQTVPLPDPVRLVETALRFVGVPYLWGGTSPFGIDCSGFVQLIYRIHNITLLRDANIQASDPRAEPVGRAELQAGDLVFFGPGRDPDYDKITHVGMVIDRKRFVHSCGAYGVVVTALSDKHYTETYWGARRMRLATLDPGGGLPAD